jgi:hypothetical protein
MPNPVTISREGDDVAERLPGDFQRHAKTGAPYVNDPTATSKHKGNKADLIVLCAQAGIPVPDKVTVPQLHELLGGRPRRVQYGRPSSLGNQIENMTNLQKWAERAVALGCLIGFDDAYADELSLGNPDNRATLDTVAGDAKARAGAYLSAERGTFVHKLLEWFDAPFVV